MPRSGATLSAANSGMLVQPVPGTIQWLTARTGGQGEAQCDSHHNHPDLEGCLHCPAGSKAGRADRRGTDSFVSSLDRSSVSCQYWSSVSVIRPLDCVHHYKN